MSRLQSHTVVSEGISNSEGLLLGGFFAFQIWGAYILEGLIYGGAYFQNFMVLYLQCTH